MPIRLRADLSAETLQARRDWQDIFKLMKGKNLQPRHIVIKLSKIKDKEKLLKAAREK